MQSQPRRRDSDWWASRIFALLAVISLAVCVVTIWDRPIVTVVSANCAYLFGGFAVVFGHFHCRSVEGGG